MLPKMFAWLNKNHKNTDMSFTEILNLVGEHNSFTDSFHDFIDSTRVLHLVEQKHENTGWKSNEFSI